MLFTCGYRGLLTIQERILQEFFESDIGAAIDIRPLSYIIIPI